MRRFETKNGSCNVSLEILDKPSKQSTDKLVSPYEERWNGFGCFVDKVISTEYHDGVHYAKRPERYLPIIDHLEQLHKNRYVHGDIRAHNMVLNYPDSECELLCSRCLLEKVDGEMRAYNLVLDFADCQKLEGWLIDLIMVENNYYRKRVESSYRKTPNSSKTSERLCVFST